MTTSVPGTPPTENVAISSGTPFHEISAAYAPAGKPPEATSGTTKPPLRPRSTTCACSSTRRSSWKSRTRSSVPTSASCHPTSARICGVPSGKVLVSPSGTPSSSMDVANCVCRRIACPADGGVTGPCCVAWVGPGASVSPGPAVGAADGGGVGWAGSQAATTREARQQGWSQARTDDHVLLSRSVADDARRARMRSRSASPTSAGGGVLRTAVR